MLGLKIPTGKFPRLRKRFLSEIAFVKQYVFGHSNIKLLKIIFSFDENLLSVNNYPGVMESNTLSCSWSVSFNNISGSMGAS